MAHEIHKDATGKASFAYVGEEAWHGLGQQLTPDAPIPLWITEAGFDWEIREAKVMGAYDPAENGTASLIEMPDKKMLYRSDTHAPLAVVGNKYEVIQPPEIIKFYEDLVEQGGFHLETAGVLFGGKRMFALAKVDEGRQVLKAIRSSSICCCPPPATAQWRPRCATPASAWSAITRCNFPSVRTCQ